MLSNAISILEQRPTWRFFHEETISRFVKICIEIELETAIPSYSTRAFDEVTVSEFSAIFHQN